MHPDNLSTTTSIAANRALYRRTLLNDVMPFWMEYSFDRKHGGIGNLLDDAGRITGHDKYLWSQGRALWTFSALYRRVEPRADWLEFAKHIHRYIVSQGRDESGNWVFRRAASGEILDGDTSLYVWGFVMSGLAEYSVATGDHAAMQLAVSMWETLQQRIANHDFACAPYQIPADTKPLGISMIIGYFACNLGEAAKRDDIFQAGLKLSSEVLDVFYDAQHDLVREIVALGGNFLETPQGRVCVPGHAIEALWFLISVLERADQSQKIPECTRLIRRHLEMAWDEECGGLRLAINVGGSTSSFWPHADCKPWWVAVESLVATAYASLHNGEAWAFWWHERIRQWSWERYPAPAGDWHQWLDREGRPMTPGVLPLKDPFHLPRALMEMDDVLARIEKQPFKNHE